MAAQKNSQQREKRRGKQSVAYREPVYINASASIAGKKEGEGPLAELIDMIGEDDLFGCNTWEEAESSLRRTLVIFLPNLRQNRIGKEIFAPLRKRPPRFMLYAIFHHIFMCLCLLLEHMGLHLIDRRFHFHKVAKVNQTVRIEV